MSWALKSAGELKLQALQERPIEVAIGPIDESFGFGS
jgi:hypothetical protein